MGNMQCKNNNLTEELNCVIKMFARRHHNFCSEHRDTISKQKNYLEVRTGIRVLKANKNVIELMSFLQSIISKYNVNKVGTIASDNELSVFLSELNTQLSDFNLDEFFSVLEEFMFTSSKADNLSCKSNILWSTLNTVDEGIEKTHEMLVDDNCKIDPILKKQLLKVVLQVRNSYISSMNELSYFCDKEQFDEFELDDESDNTNEISLYTDSEQQATIKDTQCHNEDNDVLSALKRFDFTMADNRQLNTSQFDKGSYETVKARYIQQYFAESHDIDVNEEQAVAISKTAQNVLVTARAGSGKTRTIACKTIYAIEKENINPDRVLILTFNRKAAIEVGERICNDFRFTNFSQNSAKTFHSLACGVVKRFNPPIFDDVTATGKGYEYTELIARLFNYGKYKDVKFKSLDDLESIIKDIASFISFAKKERLLPGDVAKILKKNDFSGECVKFVTIANDIYEKYIETLKKIRRSDFDFIIENAIKIIDATNGTCTIKLNGKDVRVKDIQLLLIDEFQDFSKLFFELVNVIKKYNPNMRLFCVGDDWQAINGFAGSNLKYFKDFTSFFSNCDTCVLSYNYRSGDKIVEAGNSLMSGRGIPSKIFRKDIDSAIKVINIPNYYAEAMEKDKKISLNIVLQKYLKKYMAEIQKIIPIDSKDSYIIMNRIRALNIPEEEKQLEHLSRKEQEIARKALPQVGMKLFQKYVRQVRPYTTISADTIHQFKGLEADVVIILNVTSFLCPLVKLTETTEFFGRTYESIEEEERRLFYVAVTRARKKVYLFTIRGQESFYIDELYPTEAL